MNRTTVPLLAAALASAALLSACGSSSSSPAASGSAAVATSAAAAATSAAAPAAATTADAATAMPSMSMAMPSASLSASEAATDATATEAVVHIKNFSFSTPSRPIAAGAMFTVINDDSVAHTYEDVKGAFDSGNIAGGASKQVKAPAAGTYAIKCDYHPSMHGTLTVA